MPDVFSKAKRSDVMSRIRSRGNKDTEMRLIDLMREHCIIGWRKHFLLKSAGTRVRPDFVFRRERLAVFVDGCFWHGCPKHGTWPKQNGVFWSDKITRNRARGRRVARELQNVGWKVLRIWEHSLKNPGPVITRIRKALAAHRSKQA
jgi:DNA mismatch endonuclease, patch repair protein